MATAESPQRGRSRPDAPGADAQSPGDGSARARDRWWAWAALALILAGGLALRLWGVRQGLPYAYNADEADHFVPRAVAMFAQGTLNPHYFANPPAFTYLLHVLFAVAYGGAQGAERAFALHPQAVYTLARVAAAVLGALALWLTYLVGVRLWDRAVGLLAAAIEAVAFLPVFYAHLALNDAPTLAPATLSLLGSAGVLRSGRRRDYLLAGLGLGLAVACKYTAGIMLVPLLAAVAMRWLRAGEHEPGASPSASRSASAAAARRRALGGLLLGGVCALAAFLIANPYALLDFHAFHAELARQSSLSGEAQGKLGAPKQGALAYYLWSFTWGLGWVPSLAALAGAVLVWRHEGALGWLLVPAVVLFMVVLGTEGRYFGRWLMPIFPIVCLLAAFFIVRAAAWCGGALVRRGALAARFAPVVSVAFVLAVLAQGLLYSVHAGRVLARADTRNLTRAWMLAHVPAGAGVVAEPVEPEEWAREELQGRARASSPFRWRLYPALYQRVNSDGTLAGSYLHEVGLEDYERTLAPALIGFYEREGFCWVISGSTESGRAFADPRALPRAIAYYKALSREGQVVFRSSPYARGHGPVAFDFDWSFDYYPLAYARPGPEMTIYRLHGGRCSGTTR